ncbi:UHRF1-binding protein 1-like (Syntaxin-6 Habc-interacting protein of 164 kDa) [Durusdinium trenchii]|uniref:UHRF1-binding protein 1-like (Syntaxin-6 Habc-interacting protein of 164 kDa) n=1 Tax=Durusdinium trenchii TaxID=1381693 RepID=A0ABP0HP83_9DINO
MLETLLARYLQKFLKGFTPEHISAHLLKGSVKLKEVELDLIAVHELLVDVLPCALELQKVRCSFISLKVPWKRLRRQPVLLELSGLEVKLKVHSEDSDWLAAQEKLHPEKTSKGEDLSIDEAADSDDRKEEKEEKEDASLLKVGLKEVITDGLQVVLKSLQVDLWSSRQVSPLELRVEALESFPCSVRGEKISKPQDVYEFCDPCARLFRLVQIDGLRLATNQKPGAMVEVIGPVSVQIEQRRWCGFIPQHRSRRVCPFSSETAITIRLASVALQLPVAPVMAVCEVLLDLIKGGLPFSQSELPPDSDQAAGAVSWSELRPGRAGATGLHWREQLLNRKNVTLLTLSLTLEQCGATICMDTKAAQLEAHDFMFTLDLISSLDTSRWRCLYELGLCEKSTEGVKMQCLQRIFGIYLGLARLMWSTLGSEEVPKTLLSLGLSHRPSVSVRWKDVPAVHSTWESFQPIEGCLHSVKVLVDVSAFQSLVETVKKIVMPFTELIEPPPFACSWCRIRLHDLTVEVPKQAGMQVPVKVRMPSLLFTSMEGLGELFTSLESLPSRHAWQSSQTPNCPAGEDREEDDPMGCACGRQVGTLRFGTGFAPLRGAGIGWRAWQMRQSMVGAHVPVGYDEFLDMMQASITSHALDLALPSFESQLSGESLAVQPETSPSSSSSGKKKRSWLSGFKRSSEKLNKSGAKRQSAADLAKEWATLQEAVQRLQRQREELRQRQEALRKAASEETKTCQTRSSQLEDHLVMKIAVERGKQADLSAQVEEQRQLMTQLLLQRRGKILLETAIEEET